MSYENLTVSDLIEIAKFKKVIKNYLKMVKLSKKIK